MLFARREPPSLVERARVLAWPRRSWDRSLRYIMLRMLRLRASPHQLALGFAIGVFAALTPFVGFQMLLAGLIALMLRASFAAAMLGTFFGNPITWAVIWPATYWAGCLMLGLPRGHMDLDVQQNLELFADALATLSPEMVGAAAALVWPFLKPMIVGTIPVGLMIAAMFYALCKRTAIAHQARRWRIVQPDSGYPLGHVLAGYDPAHS